MKNCTKAFVLHLIITSLSFVFISVFVMTGPTLGKYTTSMGSRIFFSIIFIIAYILLGTLLDIEKKSKYDFCAGMIITIIGMCIWMYVFMKTGKSLSKTPKELSEYWLGFNLYYSSFTIISFLLNITCSPLIALFENLFPLFLLACGMKYKRSKIKRNV